MYWNLACQLKTSFLRYHHVLLSCATTSPRTYDITKHLLVFWECPVHLPNLVYALWSQGVALFIVTCCISWALWFATVYVAMFDMALILLHFSSCSRPLVLFTSCLYIRGCVDNSAHLFIAILASSILEGRLAHPKNRNLSKYCLACNR